MLELNRIYCGDSLELMKSIPDKSINLVLTDPPYGITACDWDTVPDLQKLWIELKRVGKDKTAYVFTASQPFTTDLINSNRKWFKYCWVWNKNNSAGFATAEYRPFIITEDIVVFGKGKTIYNPQMEIGKARNSGGGTQSNTYNINSNGAPKRFYNKYYPKNLISISVASHVDREHPTQKPVKLMQYLIKTYSNEGDTILDPFLGSGTTALACLMEGRNFIGIEREQKYCDIAEKRIDQYKRQGKLNLE